MIKRHIPPLPSLRAFEASARLGSFTAAALELNVTQSAVSQAVRQLEQHLGRPLFDRGAGALRLTPEAGRYARQLGRLLDNLLEETNAVASGATPVTIACARSLLHHWLLPRIGTFHRLHPDVMLQVIGTDRHENDPSADVSLITAALAAPPTDGELLWADRLALVASPQLAERFKQQGNSFKGIPRVDTFGSDWARWFAALPPAETENCMLVLRLRETTAIYRAALEGLGVALLSAFLVADDVKAGRLTLLSERRLLLDHGVWLQSRLKTPSRQTSIFIDWLRSESAQQQDP